jgi:hypothetical protein
MRLKKMFFTGFIFFLFGLLVPIQQLHAQTCNEDMILNKKGSWKKTGDANMKAGNQSQAISRMDKMQKILQAAYPDPRGIEAIWYRSMINNPLINNGPIPYQLSALFKIYYCLSEKEMVLGDETATWFYVYANHFNWFMEYDYNFTVKKNPVYLLTKKVGEINGYAVYEGIHNGTSNTGTKYSRAIIITRPGQSPYVPVTRKQYLMLYLKRYELEKAKQIPLMENLPVKSDAEEEANKQKGLEKIEKTTSPDKLERAKSNYLRFYVTDKQRKEENLKKLDKMYETNMKAAQDLLNSLSEEEAAKPAIVSGDYVSKFENFSTEEKGGRMLVRLNPDYFNNKLPKNVPQFLIVYWRWEKNKVSEKFKEELEANFNFDALKDMIDR